MNPLIVVNQQAKLKIFLANIYCYRFDTIHLISVSGPVTDLQTNSPDNSTLVISWRPPTTPNGNIISYTVRIDNLRDGTTSRYIVDPSPVTTSLTENGLGT